MGQIAWVRMYQTLSCYILQYLCYKIWSDIVQYGLISLYIPSQVCNSTAKACCQLPLKFTIFENTPQYLEFVKVYLNTPIYSKMEFFTGKLTTWPSGFAVLARYIKKNTIIYQYISNKIQYTLVYTSVYRYLLLGCISKY
jgi:hypothetical protein